MNMAISPTSFHSPRIPASEAPAHVVQYGDTLSGIALRHGVSLEQLIAANPQIVNPDLIYPDDRITLPTPGGAEPSGVGAVGPSGAPATAAPEAAQTGGPIAGGDPSAGVSADELVRIVPTLDPARAPAIAAHLTSAMSEAGITTPQQQAMFIAQLAHESGGFNYMEEIASGAAYEGRADLGNTQPGDGERFKGRGYIQVTGRHNYAQAGEALGLDLVNNPQLASTPDNAARIAAWYWTSRNINEAANSGDFVQVTRLINGGTNGLADRQAYYARAQAALD